MSNIADTKLLSIIPPNLRTDPDIIAASQAIDTVFSETAINANRVSIYSNLDWLPESVIDHLLWQYHVTYDEGLQLATTLEEKVNLLRIAIKLHRTKGTPYAIEQALLAVKLKGEVLEWYEYGGEPFHFKVLLSQPVDLANNSNQIIKMINAYKNTRSRFEFFEIKVTDDHFVIIPKEYTFPVTYPVTGTFHTAPIGGVASKATLEAESKSYSYAVPYPVTGTFYCSEGGY